jgi:hypothetical protein
MHDRDRVEMTRIELARAVMLMSRVRADVTRWPRGDLSYSFWLCDF